jgi:hypothetical protein
MLQNGVTQLQYDLPGSMNKRGKSGGCMNNEIYGRVIDQTSAILVFIFILYFDLVISSPTNISKERIKSR